MTWSGETPESLMPNALLIAVVDDDWLFRDSMSSLLRSLGYTAEMFASAADFLASSNPSESSCLIADVQMPGLTGLELHRHLVDMGHTLPTILVTAHPNEADRVRAVKDGVICYLPKPVDEEHLRRCLRDALSSAVLPNEEP